MDLATRLYFRAPAWVQSALLSTYGLVLRRRRYGGEHREFLRQLLETQWWSGDRIEELQLDLLNRQLAAAARVRLYRGKGLPARIDDMIQLSSMPLLEKDELRRPRNELIGATVSPRDLVEIHTGGTTGKPLSVYCTPAVLQKNYAFFERFKRWAGIGFRDRTATFAGRTIVPPGQQDPPFWRYNYTSRTLLLSSYHISERTLPVYVEALRRFRPALIDSYPSSIEPIAQQVLREGQSALRPRAVITSSETLYPRVRASVEKALGCSVYDHYGAAEMAALITQCEHGQYHVNPEFGVVELLRDGRQVGPGQSGEIVATGFINDVMPLLRYRTGDWAVLGSEECPCGRSFPVVERLEGREDDVLITPDGRRIGRLDPIFKSVKSFYETRICQTAADHVRVEVVPARDYEATDEDVLRTELSRRLGPNMEIELVQVKSIPRTRSGKFRAVVNEIGSSS